MPDFKSFFQLFDKFDRWSLIVAAILICATFATLAMGYIKTPTTIIGETTETPKFVGDDDIKDVQVKIGKLIASSQYPDETLILAQLKRLFERAGFINYVTGDRQAQLYDFCVTLLIVRENMQYFKTHETRETLRNIVGTLDQLKIISQENFLSLNVSDHVTRYIKNRSDFIHNLPMDRGQDYFIKNVAPKEKPQLDHLKQLCDSIM